jgi:D-3-phosphoglycerate dehydrogenase
LRVSDIVSIHVSSQNQLLGRNEIGKMKKGAWLVNVSRGGVVNEEALYEALKNDHLSGAALDVFMDEPYEGPLKELNNVLMTAHIGSYAKESRIEMERQSVVNLLKGLG